MSNPENLPDAIVPNLLNNFGNGVVGAVAQYISTNAVTPTPYTMPQVTGSDGDILVVQGGNLVYGPNGSSPNFATDFTATNLSQGTSSVAINYTFPLYPPPDESVLSSKFDTVVVLASDIQVEFNPSYTGILAIDISAGTYTTRDICERLESGLRDSSAAANASANITISYDAGSGFYSIRLHPPTTNFTSLIWTQAGPGNDNAIFGLTSAIVVTNAQPFQTAPSPGLYVNVIDTLTWQSNMRDRIQNSSGNVVIQCGNSGVSNQIISYGNYNINGGNITNCGNITANDICIFTTNTTQIQTGTSAINMTVDGLTRLTIDSGGNQMTTANGDTTLLLADIAGGTFNVIVGGVPRIIADSTITNMLSAGNSAQMSLSDASGGTFNVVTGTASRIAIDNSGTKLYTRNRFVGPTGSFLELNDNSTFRLGSYLAGNGVIECTTNLLQLFGPQSNSAMDFTSTTITTALAVGIGGGRIAREILDTTNHTFLGPSGSEKLRISDSGVTINNTYTLTGLIGTAGQVLTRSGATATTWQTPVALNPFNQTLNTTDNVSFASVTTASLDNAGALLIGASAGGSRTFGNATVAAIIQGSSIALNGPVNVNGNYTFPTTAGVAGQVITNGGGGATYWQTPQMYGLYSQTGTAPVANTNVETTLIGAGVGSMTIPANFFSTPGISLRYATGGVFRDNANNTVFRFRWKAGVTNLFDSGNLTLTNITALIAWNVEITFTFTGGANVVTNFNFRYSVGSDARGFTVQSTSAALITANPNTFDLTVQWTVANANNTITSNYGVFSKIY